jgi:hypothetical protein
MEYKSTLSDPTIVTPLESYKEILIGANLGEK